MEARLTLRLGGGQVLGADGGGLEPAFEVARAASCQSVGIPQLSALEEPRKP